MRVCACGSPSFIKIILCSLFCISSNLIRAEVSVEENLPAMTVTATREQTKLSETPLSVGVIEGKSIRFTKPTHPQEILGQIPGVAVSVTNGEGHQTAIRQGYTTSPVYLFLEDGIPIRATGNFNHNSLYELNIPSAGGIEVIRGPGSALYGSDAIGGIVNVLTRTPSNKNSQEVNVEYGSYDYARMLVGVDKNLGDSGAFRGDINLTNSPGWRTKTTYERQSVNLRMDSEYSEDTLVKTIFAFTKIDQQTGANSALPYSYYMDSPTTNLRSVAYRKVDALRLSSSIEKDLGQGHLLTITPYIRNNNMDLNGSYNFTGDARIEKTEVWSIGMLLKDRQEFKDTWSTKLIYGLDLDYSPSTRDEQQVVLSYTDLVSGNSLYRQYTSYALGSSLYNYDVTYKNTSPYVHLESSPASIVHLSAGLRYDISSYKMENNRTAGYFTNAAANYYYYSPANAEVSYARLSPKIGATLELNDRNHLYATYNQGFRTPSESQLFRGGRATTQAEALALSSAANSLKAIEAEQYELGLRGNGKGYKYDVVVYQLTKKNDLLSYKDSTGYAVQTNNGETSHTGIELGLEKSLSDQFIINLATSYAKHTYVNWITSTINYSGKTIEQAPSKLSNIRLNWLPTTETTLQLEWVHVGSYKLDQANLYGDYPGHELLNLRLSHVYSKEIQLSARLMNLKDTRWADSASSSSSGALYAPGMPFTAYAGLELKW